MRISGVCFINYCLVNSMIFRIIVAAPINRFQNESELSEVSNHLETSQINKLEGDGNSAEVLQFVENTQQEEKDLNMFKNAIYHKTKSLTTKQTTSMISTNKKNGDIKLRAPEAGEEKPMDKSGEKPAINAKGKELTISIPVYKTDNMGNWVYNPWGVTFGDIFRDTRYNFKHTNTVPRMIVDSDIAKNYYPRGHRLSTVCVGRTSPYNKHQVLQWLSHYLYTSIRSRTINMKLRRSVYKDGNAGECHTMKYVKFLDYIKCASLRHMRMESKIPYYPRHQVIPHEFQTMQ